MSVVHPEDTLWWGWVFGHVPIGSLDKGRTPHVAVHYRSSLHKVGDGGVVPHVGGAPPPLPLNQWEHGTNTHPRFHNADTKGMTGNAHKVARRNIAERPWRGEGAFSLLSAVVPSLTFCRTSVGWWRQSLFGASLSTLVPDTMWKLASSCGSRRGP